MGLISLSCLTKKYLILIAKALNFLLSWSTTESFILKATFSYDVD